MPLTEYARWSADRAYRPKTLLLDEVIPGELYVILITNFLGGAFVRYMMGDIVMITSLRNERLNINLPQMTFYSRADGVLDFTYASFTEKVIWEAIESSGLTYVDWAARKEIEESTPRLHIYIELKNMLKDEKEVIAALDHQFKTAKEDYALMTEGFGYNLLKVTILPPGAFSEYIMKRRAAGSDLAHLKPPRINPTDEALAILLSSEQKSMTTV
jgi:phenylacetate-coenzyme A ligase PaaK-like adenylate-forming protein